MVAVYLTVDLEYIEAFLEDERRYLEDKDYRWQRDKEKRNSLARKMLMEEFMDELAECWLELEASCKRDI